jgi:hypothetical protein
MIPRMFRISALYLLLTCAHAAAVQNVSFVNGQLPFGDVLDKTLAGNVLTHDVSYIDHWRAPQTSSITPGGADHGEAKLVQIQ